MFSKTSPCALAARVLWAIALTLLLLRAGLHPDRPTSLTTYFSGGAAWAGSQPLYTNWRGFVYPPIVAWFFSLLLRMPAWLAAMLWRALTAAAFLGGLGALLRSGVFRRIPAASRPLVFIGVLPLSIGNLDNAQANPLIAGLMMFAVAAVQWEAWNLCAIAAGLAAAWKIYPLALLLLLCLLRPGQLAWRCALALLLFLLLPFALHAPHYVSGQYHAWILTRLADDRFTYPMKDAPLDLWYLLVRLGNLPIAPRAYTALQVLAAAALAGLVWRRARGGDLRDNLASLYLLASLWMLLLGPATENQTYVVLAPAASLLVVEGFANPHRPAPRILAAAGFLLLLASVARNSLTPHWKTPGIMALQPVGALLLLAAAFALTPRSLPQNHSGSPS